MAAKDADKEIAEDTVVEAAEKKPAEKAAKKAAAPKVDEAKAETKPAKKAAKAADADEAKPAKKATAKKADDVDDAKPAKTAAKKAAKAAPSEAPPKGFTEGRGGLLKTHHLRPAPGSHTAKTRVGRGEASKGKTAGRGTKGTKARYQVPARFEGGQMPLHMRLPKLRGFKNPFRTEYQVVNLDKLAALYPQGGAVTVADLVDKGAVRNGHLVKVLGSGDLAVALTVAVDACSASAKVKILAAGGSIVED